MARKLRLEYPGARYHIINRGNYRTDIFASDSTMAAFEKCLFEAVERYHWILYAFVLMRNHFHLAIATPEGNLVVGMQWLEATFANRFNRLRREQGHLFQGRYRALVIGEDTALGEVCDYIHLNPAQPKIVPMAALPGYRYSSYWYLHRPALRPSFLEVKAALVAPGNLEDNLAGWTKYGEYLTRQLEDAVKSKRTYMHLTSGWAIGSDAFKAALIAKHVPFASARAWTLPGAKEMRAAEWDKCLSNILHAIGRTRDEARESPKSAVWKLAIATWLRDAARASNGWLSQQLSLGPPSVVSRNLTRYRCRHQAGDPNWARIQSLFLN